MASAEIPAENLTENPSFERGNDGWRGHNSDVQGVLATDAPHRERVGKVRWNGAGRSYTIDDAGAATPYSLAGYEYTAQAQVKGMAANAGEPIELVVRERAPDGHVVGRATSTVTLSNTEYTFVSVTHEAVRDGSQIDVYIVRGDGDLTVSEHFFVDELALTSSVVPAGNLVENPSLEHGLQQWSALNADLSRVQREHLPHGDRAARLRWSGRGELYALDDLGASVDSTEAGVRYSARAFVKGNSENAGDEAALIVREITPGGAVIDRDTLRLALAQREYKLFANSHTAHEDGNRIEIQVAREGSGLNRGEAMFVDAVSLTRAPGP